MKKTKRIAFLMLILMSSTLSITIAQNQISHRVYLFGNYADIIDVNFFNRQLKAELESTTSEFTLILNGDMVNVEIEKKDKTNLKYIFELIDLVEEFPKGKLILLPGDRDWNNGNRGGEKSLENLEEQVRDYIKDNDYERSKWAVKDGCPGPKVYDKYETLAIIAISTQWWNHDYDKPRPSDGLCKAITQENLSEELEDAVEDNLDKNVLIVGHHPIYSLGNYGGYFSVIDHFKPFPILGSFLKAFHTNIGGKKDLVNENLAGYISNMDNLLYFHNNIIYASSHERNQQINRRDRNVLINSGAPADADYVTKNESSLLSRSESGIISIDYFEDGKVNSNFLKLTKDGFQSDDKQELFSSACNGSLDEESHPYEAFIPCVSKAKPADKMASLYSENIKVIAGPEYEASRFKSRWLGNHYRSTWTAPVSTPYLNLDTTFGGLKIFKKGGGRQTTSLKFKADNGAVYSFRSVNKDPAKALGYKLRNSIAATVFRDQTSAQHPYGAMAVAPLLDNLDILHVNPVLYSLPDDPKLGAFQKQYGGLLGMLEENPSKPYTSGKYFGDSDDIVHSSELFEELYNHNKYTVIEEEFVRARLFDILVGDWSKHEDNWKWAEYDEPNGVKYYRPIPRDRDHVFSKQDGILPWLADRRFLAANIENFGYEYGDIRSLTMQARHMDRFLMTESDRQVFIDQAKYIQDNLTEKDIEAAVRNMPAETYDLSGKEVEEKLKNRLKTLQDAAMTFYDLLAEEVEIVGSNKEETFEINYLDAGKVNVKMYTKNGKNLLYDRTFLPKETEEIRIFGLGDDDKFFIYGVGASAIKVSTFGGPGDDKFNDMASNNKTLLYDKGDETEYEIAGASKIVDYWNKDIYEYDFSRMAYRLTVPLIYFNYNRFTGFGTNLGFYVSLKDYKKDDYSSKHLVRAGITTENNFSAAYTGRFHQAIGEWDFEVSGSIAQGDFVNFFYGIGNSTVKNESLFDQDFYEAVVNKLRLSVGLVRDFWSKSSFAFGVAIEENKSVEIENTFLDENRFSIFGANNNLTILPIELIFDLDFRDSGGLPTKGTRAFIEYHNGTILSNENNNYGVAKGSVEYYMSTKQKSPLTFGMRLGGALTHGDVPWYKLPTLGDRNGLRGYFQNRFTGDRSAYANFELRYQIFETIQTFIPLKGGVKAFYDRGRVFEEGSNENNEWRSGYGFGFYIVPLSESVTISVSLGFSDEESIYPVIGIGTPLR